MNLTSAGLGMLGLQWPHYKGWGPKGQVGYSCESWPRGRVGSTRSGGGDRRVSVRWVPGLAGAAPGAASPLADAQQALAPEGCPQAPFLGIIIRGKGP